MDAVLKDILQSPRLHDYVNELQQYLLEENSKRKAFYQNMRDDEKVEFINGEIIYHSPAKEKHNVTLENLGYIFQRYVRKNQLGVIRREKALVKMRRNDFEPDISFFKKQVADKFEPNTMFYPVPDFVVEVLSDSTERIDRGVKRIDYALNGVKEYWLVDADKKFIEQYILQIDEFELAEKIQHGTVRCKVLVGLVIPLEAIFDEEKNEEFQREI